MSVIVRPPTPGPGQIVSLDLKYEGSPPLRYPNDVHIDVYKDGKWTAVTGYDTIPPDKKPSEGFTLDLPPTADWSMPGTHQFQVRWTSDTVSIVNEPFSIRVIGTEKTWRWDVFFGWLLAGAAGSAIGSAIMNAWTGAGFLACIVTGALGGMIGSALGQLLQWLLDAPRIKWTPRSAALFSLFFSLSFCMLFGLLAVPLEQAAIARGEPFNTVTLGVGFLSAFLAALLGGVLNNLRQE